MSWIETDYSKHTHFRWKIKWRLEHLGMQRITALFYNIIISMYVFTVTLFLAKIRANECYLPSLLAYPFNSQGQLYRKELLNSDWRNLNKCSSPFCSSRRYSPYRFNLQLFIA